jgi:hypothetical protein
MQVKSRRGSKPGPRPQTWVTGPDPVVHEQYRAFIQQRNQARFRGEGWTDEYSFEQWQSLWQSHWHQRGRKPEDYCMTRRDPAQPWTQENSQVIPRSEHMTTQARLAANARWSKKNNK